MQDIFDQVTISTELNLTNKHFRFLFRRLDKILGQLEQEEDSGVIVSIMEDITEYLEELKEAINELVETEDDDTKTKIFVETFFEMIETKANGIERVENGNEYVARVEDMSTFLIKLKDITNLLLK